MNRWMKDWHIKLLAACMSLLLWVYVMGVTDIEDSIELKYIPIAVDEGGSSPEDYGLTILKGIGETVNVTVRGKRNMLASLARDDVKATINLSGITVSGEFEIPVTITLPSNSFILSSKSVATVTVKTDRMVSVSIPVKAFLEGDPASGYIAEEPAAAPRSVTVTGPVAEVNYIDYAEAVVKADDFAEDLTAEAKLKLIDKNGNEVNMQYMSMGATTATVSVGVLKQKVIPVEVTLTPAEGVDMDYIRYTVSPSSITVAADPDELDSIVGLNAGSVDLARLSETNAFVLDVVLPSGVKNVDNVQTITVSVSTQLVAKKTLRVSALRIVNAAEDNTAAFVDQEMDIQLQGPGDVLGSVTAENVAVEADLANTSYLPGRYTLPVNVIVTGAKSGVTASEAYTAEIEITEKTAE